MRDYLHSLGTGCIVAGLATSEFYIFMFGLVLVVYSVFQEYVTNNSYLVLVRSVFGNMFAALIPTGLSANDLELMVIFLLFGLHTFIIALVAHLVLSYKVS